MEEYLNRAWEYTYAAKKAVNDAITELSRVEEAHEDESLFQYQIGQVVGMLKVAEEAVKYAEGEMDIYPLREEDQ